MRGRDAVDGAGVRLRRVLGYQTTKAFDPFLMLDGFDSHNPDDYVRGFPWHPHRGIETITYLVSGEMEHGDSLGNVGVINELECQWMTAGSGIIHQEMPKPSERMLGCQLWVNMPAKDKMAQPAYGEIKKEQVPVVKEDDVEVRVLSREYKGTKGAFQGKYVDVTYLDVKLPPHKEWSYSEIPNDQTLFIYLIDGTLSVDEELTNFEEKGCAVLFTPSNHQASEREEVVIKAGNEGARLVLLAAKPLGEPISWGGPVVMNTKEELDLAFEELNAGTFIK